ncbi:DUF1877 family protein [Actinoallomurus rhizosphaericola]|uniref:DUF1877 family protein n=1 Tax=Actinoallomurus rhizosphaericola TaxID=2952536 RepID=UPI0020930AA7|nr:DUF1877 family protein [Actinoallomurus rhizosphaericola]MCO5998510.1 YfbM family protein [Actinoallomurus rhizosphaericola]
MAVTLQLARITAAQLAECRRSDDTLNTLCSFDLVPMSDHLDLDWADDGIIRMCEHTGIGDVASVRRAVEGGAEVNPAYRDHPDSVMEQPMLLEPADVVASATALRDIDLERIFSALPADPQAVKDTLGGNLHDLIGDPRRYLAKHFTALRDFYTTAADQHLAVVIWCD